MWYASVVITDLAGTAHSVNAKAVGADVALELTLSHDSADEFMLRLEDYDEAVRAWFEKGCLVDVFVGTAPAPTTLVLHGMAEEIKEAMPNPSTVMLEVRGRDLFDIYLERRATATYLDAEVSVIVRDLVAKFMPYTDGTILASSFYEGAGAVADDESPSDVDGAVTNSPTWIDGVYGKALDFTAQGRVVYPYHVSFGAMDTFTVSFWFWPNAANFLTWKRIVAQDRYVAGEYAGWLVLNRGDDSGKAYIAVFCTDHVEYQSVDVTLTEDAWQLLTFTFDGTNIKAYKNGALVGSSAVGAGKVYLPCDQHGVVVSGSDSDNPIDSNAGKIDELRVWDRALSELDVEALYDYPYLHDIDETTTTLDDMRFPYRPMKDCLDDLASLSGFDYRSNPNNILVWKEAAVEDTGITYDSTDLAPGAEKTVSLYPIRNRVWVLGGDCMQEDQAQDTVGATAENSKDYYYAGSFTPSRSDLDQVSLYLKRTGSPDDLTGYIWTDSSGPSQKVASFTVDSDFIGTAGGWVPISVSASLIIGAKYWVSIDKTGDAGNCYEWYDDDGAAGENAYDADGAGAWTVQGSSYAMCLKTYYKVPVVARKQDTGSGGDYCWREEVHEDKAITSRSVANELASALLAEMKDETPSLSSLTTYNQASIPDRGKLVTVTLAHFGITAVQYLCQKVGFVFRAGWAGTPFMAVELGRSKEDLVQWLSTLRNDVDRTKIGDKGVAEGLVNEILTVDPDSVTVTDDCTFTVIDSGDFEVETAEVDFSDAG